MLHVRLLCVVCVVCVFVCVCVFPSERKNAVSLWRAYKWVLSLSGQDVGGEDRLERMYINTHTHTHTHTEMYAHTSSHTQTLVKRLMQCKAIMNSSKKPRDAFEDVWI